MSTPFSKVTLYKVPTLSPSYRDTYNFANATAREAFFATKSPKVLTSQITRITNNQIKVPYNVADVREYNYMSIRNQRRDDTVDTGASDRIYYCFITNAEYVSDLCTIITFEVDVIQTFYLEAEFGQSFVVRTHSNTDLMYEHREPEDFSVVNYTVDETEFKPISLYVVIGVVAGTEDISLDGTTTFDATGGWYLGGDAYAGVEYFIFDLNVSSDRGAIAALLASLVGREEAITDFYIVPSSSYGGSTGGSISPSQIGSNRTLYPSVAPSSTTPLSGHIPVNKKLYNYPFTMLRAISPNGQRVDLYVEEFSNNTPKFIERGNWIGNGECLLLPKEYGIRTGQGLSAGFGDFEHGLTIADFPHCSYAGDRYAQWETQKAGAQVAGMVTNAVAGLVTTGLGMVVSPAVGTLAAVRTTSTFIKDNGQIIADGIEASKKPNPIYNNTNTASLAITQSMFGWNFQRVSLSKVEAEQLDDFFTMYGYALNKKINVKSHIENSLRPKFCYIKTSGMSVMGSFPAEYKMQMNQIFDSGITFWKSSATVGDYSGNTV